MIVESQILRRYYPRKCQPATLTRPKINIMNFRKSLKLTAFVIVVAIFVTCTYLVSSFAGVVVTTGKLTITGAPPKLSAPFSPFSPVTITTGKLTITGATPAPSQPKGPFTPVVVTTGKLTITGK
jgi:hypothetical protein